MKKGKMSMTTLIGLIATLIGGAILFVIVVAVINTFKP